MGIRVRTGKLDVKTGMSTTVEVAATRLEDVSIVASVELGVGVASSASDVVDTLDVASEVAGSTLVAGTIVASEVLVDDATSNTDDDTAGTLEDVGVTSTTAEEVATESAVVVTTMLDKAPASEDAADAASPEVTAVAALLRIDCKLEMSDAIEAALLSGSTEVVMVGTSVAATDEVRISAGSVEVVAIEAALLSGSTEVVIVGTSVVATDEVRISAGSEEVVGAGTGTTRSLVDVVSGRTDVDVDSGAVVDDASGCVEVEGDSDKSVDELVMGKSDVKGVLDVGASVSTGAELVVTTTAIVDDVMGSSRIVEELSTSIKVDVVVGSAITTAVLVISVLVVAGTTVLVAFET